MMPIKFYTSFTWAIYRGQKTWMILAGKQCTQISLHMAGTTESTFTFLFVNL
jgi:hypothetical protein